MAVAFDAVGPNANGAFESTTNGSPLTWTHVTGSGSNRAIYVGMCVGDNIDDSNTLITGVSYASVPMTFMPGSTKHSNNSTFGYTLWYYLANPTTGSNTVSVTYTAAFGGQDIKGGSLTFTGVDQTTPYSNVTVAADTDLVTPSISVPSSTDDMVAALLGNGKAVTSANQTQRWRRNVNTQSASGNCCGSTAAGASSVTMSYVTTADWWSISAFSVKAVATSTVVPVFMNQYRQRRT